MKIDIHKYIKNNLIEIDVISDKDVLLNKFYLAFTDSKKNINYRKALFEDTSPFCDKLAYDVLDVCSEIVDAYGNNGDIEKLWLANKIFLEVKNV